MDSFFFINCKEKYQKIPITISQKPKCLLQIVCSPEDIQFKIIQNRLKLQNLTLKKLEPENV